MALLLTFSATAPWMPGTSSTPKDPAFPPQQLWRIFWRSNQKNKTFFFATYEGIRQKKGIPTLLNVPTADAKRALATGAGTASPVPVAP